MLSALTLSLLVLTAAAFSIDLRNYTVTFEQDFSSMKTLDVSAWGPAGPGGSTWIAHKPDGEDWVNFYNPTAPYLPFNIGDGQLTIRAAKTNVSGKPEYYGGMLSSADPKGDGFSQRYGYFEMKAKLPVGLGGWPAFWLMDSSALANRSLTSTHEIDMLEEFGDNPALLHVGVHNWDKSADWGYGRAIDQCSMTTGFHTYGIDIQSDYITWYYDRQMIDQIPNIIPTTNGTFDRPMYVMVNMAYGGGTNINNETNLDRNTLDLLVQYVRVWQGSGGSAASNSTRDADQLTYGPGEMVLYVGKMLEINGAALILFQSGNLVLINTTTGHFLWQTGTSSAHCLSTCLVGFQGDGNLVMYDDNGQAFWSSRTWSNNEGSMTIINQDPYIIIYGIYCVQLWTTHNTTTTTPRTSRAAHDHVNVRDM